ncbi:MAG TPA: transglutaminase family protein [Candidatus Limnocylindria bacterium]|jgi:transglutaminase-like putative cysteine protease|nr:transglutaminase family protein [Candidatus Limnocylindria bacterium]
MRFTIFHRTTYRYPGPVHESHTVLHLQPRSDLTQYCTSFSLEVTPRARLFSYTDRFGNDVQHFEVLPEHDTLEIVARSYVVTARGDVQAPSPLPRVLIDQDPARDELYDFLHESAYVRFTPALDALATEVGTPSADDDAVAWYRDAAAMIHRGFVYDTEATAVHTTVDESIALRRGVCQDFAHVLVALCRRAGIPARYVSGYVHASGGGEVLGAEASHAWCEAYLGPHGWVGVDPTNDTWIGDDFVRIAVGRDYRDVSPVRGVFKGAGGASTMSVDVAMSPLSAAAQQ